MDQYLKHGRKGYKVAEADRKELLLLFNRDGFSTGYYEKHNGRDLMALYQAPASDSEKKAYEKKIAELHQMYVEQENPGSWIFLWRSRPAITADSDRR